MRPQSRDLMYRADPMQNTESSAESKFRGRAVYLAVVLAFAFGLVVPVLVLTANANNKAATGPGGIRLTAEEQHGRVLFSDSCAFCHTLSATNSVGRTGPNLDIRVGKEVTTEAARRALVLSAITEGRALGLGNMPANLYQGREAEAVADFVAAVAGR
jgi:mono/diheme cytochrome c family protein